MSIPQMEFKTLEMEPPQEPKPGQKPRKKQGRRSNSSIEAQIRDELESFIQLGAIFWSTRDEICGPVLSQQASLIAEDLAQFAMKSEWARKYLTTSVDAGAVLKLMMHTLPLLQCIREHHMTPPEVSEDAPGSGPLG